MRAYLQTWQRAEHAARHALDQQCTDDFWEGAIAHTLVHCLPNNAVLHLASSMPVRDADAFASPTTIKYFASRGANGIDGTLATALGMAQANTAPAYVLVGDLAFLHDVGALQLARQLQVTLVVVVVNNGGGGIFDFLPIAQHREHFTRYFRTPQQADIGALARAAGANVQRVTSLTTLRSALAAATTVTGLSVIEAAVPSEGNAARHGAAWRAVHKQLGPRQLK